MEPCPDRPTEAFQHKYSLQQPCFTGSLRVTSFMLRRSEHRKEMERNFLTFEIVNFPFELEQ